MGKLSFGRVLDCLYLSTGSKTCFCLNSFENEDVFERKALVESDFIKLNNDSEGPKTLAFQLKPKIVVLRVSMHCNGCARQIQKQISKIEVVKRLLLSSMADKSASQPFNATSAASETGMLWSGSALANTGYTKGVTSYEVDLETKMVVVTGDILPFEVLQSISKVKTAELWTEPSFDHELN